MPLKMAENLLCEGKRLQIGDLKYEDGQRLGVNPKAESDGYADYDTDDDGASDKDESGFGDATKTGRADDSLTQYKNLVLELAGTAGSYLLLPNQARYVLSDNWTLDLWIKIDPALEGDAVLIKRTIDTKAAGNDSDTLINYELGIKKSENLWRPYVTFTVMDGTINAARPPQALRPPLCAPRPRSLGLRLCVPQTGEPRGTRQEWGD